MADLVTDISLVAGWDPRFGVSPAEVFIYTKITPQPAAKVPLLHLQGLVAKIALLRVIPLLPDGSSPRESPGIRALGIPVVAGRNRTAPQTPVGQRRVNEATFDGVESDVSSESASDGLNENSVYIAKAVGTQEADGAVLKQVEDGLASYSPAVKSGGNSPKSQKGDFGIPEGFNDSITTEEFFDYEDFFTPLKRSCASSISDFSGFRQRPSKLSDWSLTSNMGMSYTRDINGNFKPAEFLNRQSICRRSNELWDFVRPKNPDRKGRVFSINSTRRDLSPMTELTLGRIVELNAPIKDIHPGGQDGVIEDSEAVLRSSGVAAESAAAAKECSSTKSDGGIPVEGEMIKQGASETSEPEEFEPEKIKMIVEQDTLLICFPGNIRGDAVVVEIMLEMKPLYLEGKPYVTFIFAGLPYCSNGAYINFWINDREDWKFNTCPDIAPIKAEDSQGNKLLGILDLTGGFHPAAANRSLIIRALRRPIVLEVLDFKMKSNINASFSWSPEDDRLTTEFEISIIFLDFERDNDANFSVINFYLVNGPERQADITVDSTECTQTEFVLGDLDFENQEICARRCRLLRVQRPTKDAHQPVRIRFNKILGTNPIELGIPMVRVGGEATLIEESVTIVKPRLPLEAVFSPNAPSWKATDRGSGKEMFRFTRTGINMREANPSVFISCLNSVVPPAAWGMDQALASDDSFIDRINYDIQESEGSDGRGAPMVAVSMSFGVDISAEVEPMEVIFRIHTGSFGLNFATINGKIAGKGILFEDGDELLVLNCGIITGDKGSNGCKARLMVSAEWFSEQSLVLSCGDMTEFRLPRVMRKVVGRTDFECGNRQARVVSRTQHPGGSSTTSRFTRGRVITSGMDTDKNETFLQIPCEKEQGTPGTHTSKNSSRYCSPGDTNGTITPSVISMGVVTFNSMLDESFSTAKTQRQEKSETHAHNMDEAFSKVPTSHWIWSTKEILVMVLMIGLLCFNLISQSTRNSTLKASLRHTRAMLEERERMISEKPCGSLPSHSQPQKPQTIGKGSEDLWWSVVGDGNVQEIGHLTIGVVAREDRGIGSTCDVTKGITNDEQVGEPYGQDTSGEHYPNGEHQTVGVKSGKKAVVRNGPKDWKKKKYEKHQKMVAQSLLEEETLKEKTHRIVANVFRFFWFLVFGV